MEWIYVTFCKMKMCSKEGSDQEGTMYWEAMWPLLNWKWGCVGNFPFKALCIRKSLMQSQFTADTFDLSFYSTPNPLYLEIFTKYLNYPQYKNINTAHPW